MSELALKSPYNPDDQIYEHLAQCSESSIPAMYILLSLLVRHQGLRERPALPSLGEVLYPLDGRLSPEFIYYHCSTPCGIYGRNVSVGPWQEAVGLLQDTYHR